MSVVWWYYYGSIWSLFDLETKYGHVEGRTSLELGVWSWTDWYVIN
jgi:hypothetical protein